MKSGYFVCLFLILGWILYVNNAWAIDVGWMQKGVRVWYLGGVGSGTSSNAEEAYLIDAINGDNTQVTKHSAINHWEYPNTPETETYSLSDKGPFWIHPQVLQNIEMGDYWMGFEITLVVHETYTYDMLPYHFLPAKALFDLKPQREVVKLVYMIPGFSTGTAYFDAETGLCLQYSQVSGFVTIFFVLGEINYNFAGDFAFPEDNGPHTGFKSFVSEQSMVFFEDGGGSLIIQSLVEARYGDAVEMRVFGSESGSNSNLVNWDENYCFFGSVPVLKYMDATEASNYPPEQWNVHGEYLWWWIPQDALQKTTINIFNISMTRTSTAPYTFTADQQKEGLFFTNVIFDNDGYMTQFSAKDSETGADIDPDDDYFQNSTTVNGPDYYKNTMGTAVPDPDGDNDGMSDQWEFEYFNSTSRDGTGDNDGDGLTDLLEYQNNTDPTGTDSDDDGLNDGDEVNTYKTDPVDSDTDDDGMPDGWEVTNVLNPLVNDAGDDADSDGFKNLFEYNKGTDPRDPLSHPSRAMPWMPLLLGS